MDGRRKVKKIKRYKTELAKTRISIYCVFVLCSELIQIMHYISTISKAYSEFARVP